MTFKCDWGVKVSVSGIKSQYKHESQPNKEVLYYT